MVQISPLLYVIPVISHSSLSSSTPDGGELAVRQDVDTSDLPAACQTPCQVINALRDCTTVSCMCTTSIGSQLDDCLNCLVSADPSVASEAQSALDSWNSDCNGTLTLSASATSSSGAPSSSGSSTVSGSIGLNTVSSSSVSSTASRTTSASPSSSTGTSSSGGGSSGGAKSGGAVALGPGNIAACAVAVLGIASAFLYL